MNNYEFFLEFSDNIEQYFIIAVIVLTIGVIFINKLATSWFNPVKYNLFQFCIGISVVLYLYKLNLVSTYAFTYVILSILLFFCILYMFYPKHIGKAKIQITNDRQCQKAFFIICYSIYILSTLLTYVLRGIPIFNDDSRLVTFTGAGGLGIIYRFSPFLLCYSLFYIYHRFFSKRLSKLGLVLLMAPFVIFGVLSGSRSSFLTYIFAFWGYKKFYKGEEIQLTHYKKLLIIALVVTLFTFAIEKATNLSGAWLPMFTRILACGDLYWMSLPNDVWKNVTANSPWSDVTVGLLAPLRLMPESNADMPIGFQLVRLVNKGFEDTTGPVELFPISTLIYFGYFGGLVFTLFQALFVCKLVASFFKRSNSLILSSFLFFCFWRSLYFLGSFRDGMGNLFSILVSFIILVILSILFGCKFDYRKRG